MRRVDPSADHPNASKPVYEIDVLASPHGNVQTFGTRSPITAPSAHRMGRRGTRVWTVTRKGDFGPNPREYVLKDTWIGSDRELEGSLLEELHRPNGDSTNDISAFSKHFWRQSATALFSFQTASICTVTGR